MIGCARHNMSCASLHGDTREVVGLVARRTAFEDVRRGATNANWHQTRTEWGGRPVLTSGTRSGWKMVDACGTTDTADLAVAFCVGLQIRRVCGVRWSRLGCLGVGVRGLPGCGWDRHSVR